MTATTETVRSQGFSVVEADITAQLTIAQWRAGRARQAPVSRRPPRRRRALRLVVAA